MRLRHRIALLLGALAIGCLVSLSVVATGLLDEIAAASPHQLSDTLSAAHRVIWLAAAAICALAIGVSIVASRLWVVAPIEHLARDAGDSDPHEIATLQRSLQTLRKQVRDAELDRHSRLDAIQALLEKSAVRLASADRLALTGQLALGAAHELGSPLAIAVACVDSLRLTSPDTGTAYVQQIDEALSRLDAIVRELSEFGLPARGVTEPGQAHVAEVVEATCRLARLHSKCRHTKLIISGQADLAGQFAQISPRHLEQIVLNLIINAADATANQGHIDVRMKADTGSVLIAIKDDGPGLDSTLAARIFEPFFTTKPEGVGSGLGLAVSRRLARGAGGDLSLVPHEGPGAEFHLRVPSTTAPDRDR
ncbi:MAG: HAMP domain-containing histidine kinase [Myxococcales bacterium]|nr:HAMP domain-containing histidine kinase [Myxococcales bacterium]